MSQAFEQEQAYSAGFHVPENYAYKSQKGLNETIVAQISEMKGEPSWMRDFRLKSLKLFEKRPMPTWGADLSGINFDDIYYYIKPVREQGKSWNDIPTEIKDTFDRLGIPQAEQKYLAGVTAQYESEAVYHKVREDLEKLGVIFTDMDTALREYPDLVKEHFGTIIPPSDNKFASLNSAVWSGGSFVYVPENVRVEIPLQAYFRINAQNMGQFERTLIIAAPGSYVHYVEGCTAPSYTSDSLHSAVVELKVMEGARVRYTTIQNWSKNVYNLVTKRAAAYRDATMEWVDGNLGSKVTMKYPAVLLMEPGARGDVLSVAFANDGMHQDAGAKITHLAPHTTSQILSRGRVPRSSGSWLNTRENFNCQQQLGSRCVTSSYAECPRGSPLGAASRVSQNRVRPLVRLRLAAEIKKAYPRVGRPLASAWRHPTADYARSGCGRSLLGPGFNSRRLH
jgi:Fe-S cluster assembly protein SufB